MPTLTGRVGRAQLSYVHFDSCWHILLSQLVCSQPLGLLRLFEWYQEKWGHRTQIIRKPELAVLTPLYI